VELVQGVFNVGNPEILDKLIRNCVMVGFVVIWFLLFCKIQLCLKEIY